MSYTKPSISGYNASPPSDDGAQTSANTIKWSNHVTKLGDPLKSYADAINNAVESALNDLSTATDETTEGAVLIGYKHGGSSGTFTTGATASTVSERLDNEIYGSDFGVAADGVTDDTPAIQAALNYMATHTRKGGILRLGPGRHIITGTLVIKCENVQIVGNGNRNAQSPKLSQTENDVPTTLYKSGTGACIQLDTQYPPNGFKLRDITLLGDTDDKANIYGIEFFLNSSSFYRDFIFERCTVTDFNTAFLLNRDAGASEPAIGVIRITHCNIMHNTYIFRHTGSSSSINGFVFDNNEAGQNGFSSGGGIYAINAHNVSICNNILEGQRDAVYLQNAFRSAVIRNNYFESNVGVACIQLENTEHAIVGPNFYQSISSDYKVKATRCIGGKFFDPVWQQGSMLCETYEHSTNVGSTKESTIIIPSGEVVIGQQVVKAHNAKVTNRSGMVFHGTLPGTMDRGVWKDGSVMAIGSVAATSGNLRADTYTISAASGDLLVVSYAVKYIDATEEIYTAMRINGSATAADGSWESPFYNFDRVPTGEWLIVTLACQALTTVTSLQVYYYPFGLTHTGTKTYHSLKGIAYACSDPSEIKPYVDVYKASLVSAAPTTGTWVVGDRMWNSSPASASPAGWICGTAGSPGTWLSMANLT